MVVFVVLCYVKLVYVLVLVCIFLGGEECVYDF